jgi:hypothetical protein
VQQYAALVDKKIIVSIALILTISKNKKRSRYKRVNLTKLLTVLGTAVRAREKSVTLNILAVYNKFINIFIKKTGINALLKY